MEAVVVEIQKQLGSFALVRPSGMAYASVFVERHRQATGIRPPGPGFRDRGVGNAGTGLRCQFLSKRGDGPAAVGIDRGGDRGQPRHRGDHVEHPDIGQRP